jgi:hypothetical protein
MDRLNAGLLENAIVTKTKHLEQITVLMGSANNIYHNWSKAILSELAPYPDLFNRVNQYIKSRDPDYSDAYKIKNVKVSSLKKLSIWTDILAETFRVIEESVNTETIWNEQKQKT